MDEKKEFTQRLHAALKRAGVRQISPTKLAIDFNTHHQGKPISTQAAHKCLNGRAIPGQDNIRTIAEWLNAAPEWLRYGDDEKQAKGQNIVPYRTLEELVLSDFRKLNAANQTIARELISTLLRLEKTK
jgi:hypothetical protein